MSSFLDQARARSLRPLSALPRPRLTIVPRMAARAPRIPFVALVVTVLAAGLVGLLLLNTYLQQGAYVVTDLRSQTAQLQIRQQNLQLRVAGLKQPQRVAEKAVDLGMVRNDSPAFLSLSTGRVVGQAAAGVAGNRVHLGRRIFDGTSDSGKFRVPAAGEGSSLGTGLEKVAARR